MEIEEGGEREGEASFFAVFHRKTAALRSWEIWSDKKLKEKKGKNPYLALEHPHFRIQLLPFCLVLMLGLFFARLFLPKRNLRQAILFQTEKGNRRENRPHKTP